MVKVVEKLKGRLLEIQVDERHNLDSLGLLYEELQDLRKEALLADSELDALHEELNQQNMQTRKKRAYISELNYRLYELHGLIDQKNQRLQ